MMQRRWNSALLSGAWWLVVAMTLPLVAEAADERADEVKGGAIELAFVNGQYTELDANLKPIEQGPLTIRLSSPEHQLTVHRNHMTFAADGSGAYAATVEVELEGGGKLFADVEGVGMSSRFEDDVEAPRQTLKVAGKVRLERVDGGYRVTFVEAPTASRVEIKSNVIRQIVNFCSALDGIPLISLDCPAIDKSLTRQQVPMPQAGEHFFLTQERLSEEERAFFDRLSAGSAESSTDR